MLVDSLLSVKVITADGRKITASNTENSDLFWGIRGAGCNFGTILEATYSIYDETAPLVLNADFLFPPNASQTILEYFKTLENNLPAELSFVLLAGRAAQLGGVSSQKKAPGLGTC
jgi:FAD/FMN-containing dehydrogenase